MTAILLVVGVWTFLIGLAGLAMMIFEHTAEDDDHD